MLWATWKPTAHSGFAYNYNGGKTVSVLWQVQIGTSGLDKLIGDHGTVESAQIIMDRDTGQSKGFAFVEMSSDAEAQAAIGALDGKDTGGRALKVNEARPRESRDGGGNRSRY